MDDQTPIGLSQMPGGFLAADVFVLTNSRCIVDLHAAFVKFEREDVACDELGPGNEARAAELAVVRAEAEAQRARADQAEARLDDRGRTELQLRECQVLRDALQAQLAACQAQLAAGVQAFGALQAQHDACQQARAELQGQLEELRAEVDAERKRADDAESLLRACQNIRNGLRDQLDDRVNELRELRAEVDTERARADQAEARLRDRGESDARTWLCTPRHGPTDQSVARRMQPHAFFGSPAVTGKSMDREALFGDPDMHMSEEKLRVHRGILVAYLSTRPHIMRALAEEGGGPWSPA
eukprot:tig00000492_g1438.t1